MSEIAKKRLKIAYLITKSNWGGAGRYVFDLASHLSANHDVVVGLGGNGPLKTALEGRGVRTISLPSLQRDVSLLKEISAFFDILQMLRSEKPDVLHLNSSKAGGLGALAGRIAGVKQIIFTAHGWAFNEDRSWLSTTIILFLHWVTILLCTKTIAVSRNTADDVAFLPMVKERLAVVHNGIGPITRYSKTEARRLLSERSLALKAVNMPAHKPLWVGTISELHPNKGLVHFIDTIVQLKKDRGASLPHFVAVIIGEGEQRQFLEQLIQKHRLEETIFLLGRVPNAAEFLNALDIFTLTSTTEALPYAVLEAGAAHLPVIASNVGGISEIITQLETGILVRSNDQKELVEAIHLLLTAPEKRQELGKALEQHVTTAFSVEAMCHQTEQLYS